MKKLFQLMQESISGWITDYPDYQKNQSTQTVQQKLAEKLVLEGVGKVNSELVELLKSDNADDYTIVKYDRFINRLNTIQSTTKEERGRFITTYFTPAICEKNMPELVKQLIVYKTDYLKEQAKIEEMSLRKAEEEKERQTLQTKQSEDHKIKALEDQLVNVQSSLEQIRLEAASSKKEITEKLEAAQNQIQSYQTQKQQIINFIQLGAIKVQNAQHAKQLADFFEVDPQRFLTNTPSNSNVSPQPVFSSSNENVSSEPRSNKNKLRTIPQYGFAEPVTKENKTEYDRSKYFNIMPGTIYATTLDLFAYHQEKQTDGLKELAKNIIYNLIDLSFKPEYQETSWTDKLRKSYAMYDLSSYPTVQELLEKAEEYDSEYGDDLPADAVTRLTNIQKICVEGNILPINVQKAKEYKLLKTKLEQPVQKQPEVNTENAFGR